MLRALVVLLIGVLIGANIVYFAMTRSARHEVAANRAVHADAANAPMPASPEAGATAPASPAGQPAPAPVADLAKQPVVATPSPAATPAAVGANPSQRVASGPSGLIVPVSGVAAGALVDTYTDARSEGRSHDAIDIMAPAGTPVLAAADGHVEKLFTSDRGGLTIYQFEPGGRYAYYYAHLQSYAPGLREKQAIRQGEVIGYVGSTGNASADAPHLHFAIFVLGPEKQWWKGTAINPYPVLRGKTP